MDSCITLIAIDFRKIGQKLDTTFQPF